MAATLTAGEHEGWTVVTAQRISERREHWIVLLRCQPVVMPEMP